MIELIQYGYLETPYLSEFPYLQPAAEQGLALQAEYQIGTEKVTALQFLGTIINDKPLGTQFAGLIENFEKPLAVQGTYAVVDENVVGLQASVINTQDKALAAQGQYVIEKENVAGFQFDAFITQDKVLGLQAESTSAERTEWNPEDYEKFYEAIKKFNNEQLANKKIAKFMGSHIDPNHVRYERQLYNKRIKLDTIDKQSNSVDE